MFESFRKFLSDVSEGGKHPTHFEHNDYRLAAAALLVHTAAIDGNVSELERDKLHVVIKRQFGLDEATTDELVAALAGGAALSFEPDADDDDLLPGDRVARAEAAVAEPPAEASPEEIAAELAREAAEKADDSPPAG